MNLEIQKKTIYLLAGLACIVIASRLLPHAPNFTGAMAAVLFSATVLRNWKAFTGILVAYLFSDLIINNIMYRHNHFIWLTPDVIWILLPFVIVFAANLLVFRKEISPLGVMSASLVSSIVFFLVSNLGEWITSTVTYTHDINGFFLCYLNALPFFAYELGGTLFYSSIIFSVYWLYFYPYKAHAYTK